MSMILILDFISTWVVFYTIANLISGGIMETLLAYDLKLKPIPERILTCDSCLSFWMSALITFNLPLASGIWLMSKITSLLMEKLR